MKKLFQSLLFIAILLLIVDRIGGKILWWINENTKARPTSIIKYLAESANEDLIILGTSRAYRHYDPEILADSFKMSIYNGGISASKNIYVHYILLNMILRHHTPKIVCLELSKEDYYSPDKSFPYPFYFLAPYIGKEPAIDTLYHYSGDYWPYKMFHLCRYNAGFIRNMTHLERGYTDKSNRGFIPLKLPKSRILELENEPIPTEVDEHKLLYLQKFIALCKQHDITLVLSTSPQFSKAPYKLYDPLKRVATENGIPYFEYHTRDLFLDKPEYFYNATHLCDVGAKAFTAIFAHDLKEYLNKEEMVK